MKNGFYKRLLKELRKNECASPWIRDNTNRLMLEAAEISKVKINREGKRIKALAQELTRQSNGIITSETVKLCGRFELTNGEYDLLPVSLKQSLLDFLYELLCEDKKRIIPIEETVKSLILFNDIDFESLRKSVVKAEELLLSNGDYRKSDEASKSLYRKKIAELTRKTGKNEAEIIQPLLDLGLTDTLFAQGKGEVPGQNARLFIYIASALLLMLAPELILLRLGILIGVIGAFPLFFTCVNIINRIILKNTSPRILPALKSEYGDTPQNKCVIALTVLLQDEASAQRAVERLEEIYASDRLNNGVYIILGDFREASREETENDKKIISVAESGIEKLNRRFGNKFALIIRKRVRQGNSFYGFERKRGALEELVRYISGEKMLFASEVNASAAQNSRYLCVLDADTAVLPEQITRLLCTIAHPANKWGLIQPAMGILPKNRTAFSRLLAYDCGIGGYSRAIGEINNDFLLSGSFCGKGILSVEKYKSGVLGKIKPNRVLSHDLLEGEMLSSALAGSIMFADEFPQNAISYYKRQERWIRGDWQNTDWLFSTLPAASKWKIFYNLLSSAYPFFMLLLFALAPFYGKDCGYIWLFAVIELLLPYFLDIAQTYFAPADARRDSGGLRKNCVLRAFYALAFLPLEGFINFTAACTGLFRRFISRRNVLSWSAFSSADSGSYNGLIKKAWISAAVFSLALILGGKLSLTGLSFALLWFIAPLSLSALGKSEYKEQNALSNDEAQLLRLSAMRKLNFFYEALKQNKGIMPDNFQERPFKGYAERTSPTDLGFALLAPVCGHALGLYPPKLCIKMVLEQINAIKALPTSRGHLYNWYNTKTLKPLNDYISVVDSGNFCAALVCLRGWLEILNNEQPCINNAYQAMSDYLLSYSETGSKEPDKKIAEYILRLKARDRKALYDFASDTPLHSLPGMSLFNEIIQGWLDTGLGLDNEIYQIKVFTEDFLKEIDFAFFFNQDKKLLYVGGGKTPQKGCYDMLMSEARLTGFLAIALGQIPAEHWFRLARPFARINGAPICLSWGGTCFEYLMSDIFIKPPTEGMLYFSQKQAVMAQINAAVDGIWGISESAFSSLDANGEYKYRAFGVRQTAVAPIKTGRVVSPYSAELCIEYAPKETVENLKKIVEKGGAGQYGFFEAVDYGKNSPKPKIVHSYMAHHSGMGLCALTNYLCNGVLRSCFSKSSFVRSASVLLDERMPLGVTSAEFPSVSNEKTAEGLSLELSDCVRQGEVLFASRDEIGVTAGSRGEISIFDGNCFFGDVYSYITDEGVRSIAYNPVAVDCGLFSCKITPECIEYMLDCAKEHFTERVFCEGDNCVLEISCINKGKGAIKKEIAVAAATALNGYEAYVSHPYFNGLMLEAAEENGALMLHNRKTGKRLYLYCADEECVYCSDAMKLFGRNRDKGEPSLDFSVKSKTYPVNPCMGAKVAFTVDGGKTKKLKFVFSKSKPTLLSGAAVDLAYVRAKQNAYGLLAACGLTRECWLLSLKIGALLQTKSYQTELVTRDKLWALGIDDRIPLITLTVSKRNKNLENIIAASQYLFLNGVSLQLLAVDLGDDDYLCADFNAVEEALNRFGGAFRHIKKSAIGNYGFLRQVSNVYYNCDEPELLGKKVLEEIKPPTPKDNPYPPARADRSVEKFDNGIGGFCRDGYRIYAFTPVPWSNISAENGFGTLMCENGGGFTWAKSSALNKLTPFFNDAVENPLGEAVYLRDNALNRFWSITTAPCGEASGRSVFFGKGYGVYEFNGYGIAQEQTVFAHKGVKVISVTGEGCRNRDISLFFYLKPMLCEKSNKSRCFTCLYEKFGALCAKSENGFMFIYSSNAEYAMGDDAFLGNGKMKKPDALAEGEFRENGGEPAMSLKAPFHGKTDIFIGFGETEEEMSEKIEAVKSASTEQWLEEVKDAWSEKCGKITISTPDEELNTLFNNSLIYQTLSSRIYAKCGFYQAGGAWGFRDLLQDCLELIYTEAPLVRDYILMCANHQFIEGDVQHWWHEPYLGVRTRISDDLLFLPLTASKYASVKGDYGIFDEVIPFIEGLELKGRDEIYGSARESEEKATLYEHCMRAIRLVIKRRGAHGLPLILCGDWNDGLNNIGSCGKGESVWLGWFLYHIISVFIPVCEKKKPADITELKSAATELYRILNSVCFQKDRFIRAFDDDGAPVGASYCEECKIDSIAQSWAALSGAGKSELCRIALDTAERELIDRENGIVRLLSPPFNGRTKPGYIGHYIPGIRENGGQYTHGALWLASALAQMGEGEKCVEILRLINPITHTGTKYKAEKYRAEPYVLAADVYSGENAGRAGWTWYTASPAICFNTVLNSLLGIDFENGNITVSPHIPASWQEFSVHLEACFSSYEIRVLNPNGKTEGVESISTRKKDGITYVRVIM